MITRRGQIQTPEQSDALVETSQLLMKAFRSVRMKGVSLPQIGCIKRGMSKHPAFLEAVNILEREKII